MTTPGDFRAELLAAADLLREHGMDAAADALVARAGGKVWLLTNGTYSDYTVECVFTSREKAEAFLREAAGEVKYNDLEEFELDALAGQVLRQEWRTLLDCRTGAVEMQWVTAEMAPPGARGAGRSWADHLHALGASYVSQGHADKLAAEARQQWLREKVNA